MCKNDLLNFPLVYLRLMLKQEDNVGQVKEIWLNCNIYLTIVRFRFLRFLSYNQSCLTSHLFFAYFSTSTSLQITDKVPSSESAVIGSASLLISERAGPRPVC